MIRDLFRWLDTLTPRQEFAFTLVFLTCCMTLTILFNALGRILW